MDSERHLFPEPMIELPGVPVWTPERLSKFASFIDRLEKLIDLELAEKAVREFVNSTIDVIHAQIGKEQPRSVEWIKSQLETDDRFSVHRAVNRFILNIIDSAAMRRGEPKLSRELAWNDFTRVEAAFLRRQFILLWLDILIFARIHHPAWNEEVPLTADLLPTINAPCLFKPTGFQPSLDSSVGHIFSFNFAVLRNIGWESEYTRLIGSACCTRGHELLEIRASFSSKIEQKIRANDGELTLIETEGRTLVLKRTPDGPRAIAPIKPEELEAWGIGQDKASMRSIKNEPWEYAVRRLHEISDEYLKLEKSMERELIHDEDKDMRLLAMEAKANSLIDLLMHSNCVPDPLTEEIRGKIEVALRAMANVLPEYEDNWLDDCLREIFGN